MTKTQIMDDFKSFVKEHGVSTETVNQFIRQRKADNTDMLMTINAMKEYADSTKDELLVSEVFILMTDFNEWCGGTMKHLSKTTQNMYGDEVWGKIFKDVKMPEVGWTADDLSDFTYKIEQKYLSATTKENYECAQKMGNPFTRSFTDSDKKHLAISDVDLLINKLNTKFLNALRKCHKSGELFFNQKIDDVAMKEYETGRWSMRREGSKIILTKNPYMMSKYLTETDNKLKRYYACHCPWARQSILTDKTVSKSFCYCSFGHDKYELESAFGRQLDGRVVCSVLEEGNIQCIFEVDIPDDIKE
ncbi:MAG: hypothetical protein FWC92_02235 [Defluviitaleaceae bacterium]|nr:hypothetical protein [Defluviitaleaceae bacterium]